MRTVAILANIGLLLLVGRLVTGGNFEMNSSEAPLFLFMVIAPILSIVALLLRGCANKDWLAVYCERKALEERQKVERVRARMGRGEPVGAGARRD